MEGTQVFVNLKQCLVVPGFRKKGVCIRPAAQQGLVDGEDFCSRLSGPEGKIMLPCMFVIFHRKKVVDDEVQNSIPAHQGHGAGRRWGRKRYMGAPVGVCKGGEVLRQLFRMSGKAKTLKRIKICCDDGQRPYAPLRMVGRPVAGIRPGKGSVRRQFKLCPQGPPLSPEFFVEFYGFRCAGGRKNGKEEARRTEKQGFRTVPDGTQGRPQGQVAHGGLLA